MAGNHPPVTDWTTDFDHTDEVWAADPYPIWADIRASECPVVHSDRYGGVWLPTRHEDVSAIAYDTEHFTSQSPIVSEGRPMMPAPQGIAPPISSDPPFHHDARRLLLPAFSPKAVEELEPFTRQFCNDLLDRARGPGRRRRCRRLRPAHPGAGDRQDAGLPGRGRRHLPHHHPQRPRKRGPAGRKAHRELRPAGRTCATQIEDHIANPRDDLTNYLLQRRDGRRAAERRARGRHHGPVADRRHRHHLERHRGLAVASGQDPVGSSASGRRARTAAAGHRGVPAGLCPGDHGPSGQGRLRVQRLPDEGRRLGAAAVPGRQP